jgi:deoxyhypusine synthase
MKDIIPIEPTNDLDELMKRYGSAGFGARRLSNAIDILEKAIRDKCFISLGLAGAMVPAGMKSCVNEFIRNGWVNAIVTTGANMTHDIIESIGYRHHIGSHDADDKKLHKQNIDRIYDVYMDNEVYEGLEDFTQKVLPKFQKKKYSSKDFFLELAKHIKDENSIIKNCAKHGVSLYCPALVDCGLGYQIWAYKQENELDIDLFLDWEQFVVHEIWGAKRTACLLIGGGVPKNFILQAQQFSDKEHSYAVQITMDRPEPGGLSGAELREAVSWGKLGENSSYSDLICDATIALPIIASVLKKRLC